jgi:hypothetical protein
MNEDCIRCREELAIDDQRLCGHCIWAIVEEVQYGLVELVIYLRNWARFSDYCQAHGRV